MGYLQFPHPLATSLQAMGGGLHVHHAEAQALIPRLARELKVDAVFTNEDYEPDAIARDLLVRDALMQSDIGFHTFKDTVIFEKDEVLTQVGGTYSVFTPYKNAWLKKSARSSSKPSRSRNTARISPHRHQPAH